jgi:hypothetical protein
VNSSENELGLIMKLKAIIRHSHVVSNSEFSMGERNGAFDALQILARDTKNKNIQDILIEGDLLDQGEDAGKI